MADELNLKDALSMFVSGAQSYGLSTAISDAQEKVQQVKIQGLKATEERQVIGNIAMDLTARMVGMGASASSVEQAAKAVGPRGASSAQDAVMQGELYGDKALAATGRKMISETEGRAERADQRRFSREMSLMLAKTGLKTQELGQDELKKVQSFDDADIRLKSMISQIQKQPNLVGVVAGRIPGRKLLDTDFAAFKTETERFFNDYRHDITGAGAQPSELEMLKESTPVTTDPPNIFLAKARRTMAMGQKIKQRFLQNLAKGGRNVSRFGDVAAAQSSNPYIKGPSAAAMDRMPSSSAEEDDSLSEIKRRGGITQSDTIDYGQAEANVAADDKPFTF